MPQASDEDREDMVRRFGSIDTEGPESYLKRHGWTLHPDWTWSKPGQHIGSIPRAEFDCIKFLIHEWDYGTIRGTEKMTNDPVLPKDAVRTGKRIMKALPDFRGSDQPEHEDYLKRGGVPYETFRAPDWLWPLLLIGKLHEEADEVRQAPRDPNEYADVLIVLGSLAKVNEVSLASIKAHVDASAADPALANCGLHELIERIREDMTNSHRYADVVAVLKRLAWDNNVSKETINAAADARVKMKGPFTLCKVMRRL